GSIQPHGLLLTLDEKAHVLQASENVESMLGRKLDLVVGKPLATVIGTDASAMIVNQVRRVQLTNSATYLGEVRVGPKTFLALAHQHDGVTFLELEPASHGRNIELSDLQPFVNQLHGLNERAQVCQLASDEVRRITGFDRVLVYQFDSEWNGTVIAESRNNVLPSYLDLRWPASDIPKQARELYHKNRLRLIGDVDYRPAALVPADNPKTGAPLDLSYATLRSVSPVHREYMRNMETAASMSVSILRDGELWGLLSCHNQKPLHVSFTVRAACDFIGQILALQLAALERNEEGNERVRLKKMESRLLARMGEYDDFIKGLTESPAEFMEFAAASSAAVVSSGQCTSVGDAIDKEQILGLADWLSMNIPQDVFSTDALSTVYPPAQQFAEKASGLLAVRISLLRGTYVLWFRPEVIQTVRWGGDPTKPVHGPGQGLQLHPRKSFEMWKETVRHQSRAWSSVEVESANDLRTAIVGTVLRKAEELAELSSELERSNQELETFSYSVSHDLRAPFRHIVGFSELLKSKEKGNLSPESGRYIENIIDSARYAGKLVDHLLELSRITRRPIHTTRINLGLLAGEVARELTPEMAGRQVKLEIGELPEVSGDPVMLRLVLRNLLSNALKFTRHQETAVVQVGSAREFGEYKIWVRDNGVGFDQRYAHKLFGVFQRLHRQEEYEGAGVGLANVRRMIARHRGRTWGEGEFGKGATFYFSVPAELEEESQKAAS
ncbi:MAG TPA: ATP-binding protein, partial [Terriglobales bacterium]